ncbi:hypothetical protein MAJ_02993, partial [Metarhizium majus ARSEF 297]
MRNRELPAGNINLVTHGRPVNGYVNVNSTGSQRNLNDDSYTFVDSNLNASITMPYTYQGSQPTPAGSSRPNKAYLVQMHPQIHAQWSMARNSQYQSPHAPGRAGANTPMIARGQAPFNSPYPQRYLGLPQRMMPPGPHENQLPNRRMPQYCQPPLAQPSPDVPRDVIRQGQYGQAVQTGDQGAREPRLNITSTRPQPNTTPAGTSRQMSNVTFPGRPNTYKQQDDSVNEGAKGPVLTVEPGSVVTQQSIDTGDENDFLLRARAPRLSAAVKEAVEKAFENGLLEGQGVVFSSFEREFRKSRTIFGVTATVPKNKRLDQVIKNVQDHLEALFVTCKAEVSTHKGVRLTRRSLEKSISCLEALFAPYKAEVSNHDGVKQTRQSLEKSISNGNQEALAHRAEETSRTNDAAAGAQESNEKNPSRANQAIHSNKTPKSARREASSQIARDRRRSKRKSVDYTIVGVHDEYSYEGNKFPSYKCSDGHRRISSPTMVEERTQQQTRAPANPANPANPTPARAMGTPSHTAKTFFKRELEPESDCPPVSKRTKVAHPSDPATMSLPSGASFEPVLFSLANQNATETMPGDFNQLQNLAYHMQQQTDPYAAAGITTAVFPDNAENNLLQPTNGGLDEVFDWGRFEADFGHDGRQTIKLEDAEQAVAARAGDTTYVSTGEGVAEYDPSVRDAQGRREKKQMPKRKEKDAAERHRAADQGPEGKELQGEQKRPAIRGGMVPIIEPGTAAGNPSRACQEFDAPTMSSGNAGQGGMLPVAGDLLGYFDSGFDAYVGYDGADNYNELGVPAGGQLFSEQLEDLGFGVGQ